MKFIILLAAVAVRVLNLNFLIILMNLLKAANAWDAKKTFMPRNEVEALSCDNGKADLADGQEVLMHIFDK